ncbi:isoprenoid synthase domain-containing protein [Amanita rubescens]|nr:isoprenoid synthase domain-containing protein [Amanita rubescens]
MSFGTRQFILPDLKSQCPFKGSVNPYYLDASAESRAWINSFNVFTDRKQAFFIQGCNELLVSHTYPYAGYEQFRTACDFVNLLFVIDELSDDMNGADARSILHTYICALQDPDWDDGSVVAQITKDFRKRFLRTAGPNAARRFYEYNVAYTYAVGIEAELREKDFVLDVQSYVRLRRNNSAVLNCFGLIEYAHGTDLPDEVLEDSIFRQLLDAACDLVCWTNDVYSYNMEQAKGHHGNNIVTVLMKEKKIGLQDAVDYIGEYCQELMNDFLVAKASIGSFGPSIDAQIHRFIHGLECWVVGNLNWSFESQRYFGVKHLEVKETLVVTLRPKEIVYATDSDTSDSE